MRITNLKRFRKEVAKYDKGILRALLEYFAFERILSELVLADALRQCKKNGEPIPKSQTLADYRINLEGERILIGLLGRRESAKVYGAMEGITSDIKTVDFILSEDAWRRATRK